MPITAAIDITRAEMARSEIYINENVAIPPLYDVQAILQERNSFHSAGERSVKVCTYDWLTTVGAGSSFSVHEKRKATEDAVGSGSEVNDVRH